MLFRENNKGLVMGASTKCLPNCGLILYYLIFCTSLHITFTHAFTKDLELEQSDQLDSFDLQFIAQERGASEKIEYVKNKYQQTLFGQDCLFYPATNPERLWILFGGRSLNLYTMWSWFWREDEQWENTAYLFLKDDSFSWYLGSPTDSLIENSSNIIKHFTDKCGLSNDHVFSIGHSMGGYAALFYGITLGFKGIFAFRPQIDWLNALRYFAVSELSSIWQDIDFLLKQSNKPPYIYIQYGEFPPDKDAALKLVNVMKEKESIGIIQKTMNTNHVGFNPTKEFIKRTLDYFDNIDK